MYIWNAMFNKNETMEKVVVCVTSELRCSKASFWSRDFLKFLTYFRKIQTTKQRPEVSEPHVLDFDLSWLITNFNMVISTFCNQFHWSGMRVNSWWVSVCHSRATVWTTLSSVTLCLSNKWGWLISYHMQWHSPLVISCTLYFQQASVFY